MVEESSGRCMVKAEILPFGGRIVRNWVPTGGGNEVTDNKLRVYRDVWQRLYDEVLNEKTSWGKEELKKRMDKMLIEEMEKYL